MLEIPDNDYYTNDLLKKIQNHPLYSDFKKEYKESLHHYSLPEKYKDNILSIIERYKNLTLTGEMVQTIKDIFSHSNFSEWIAIVFLHSQNFLPGYCSNNEKQEREKIFQSYWKQALLKSKNCLEIMRNMLNTLPTWLILPILTTINPLEQKISEDQLSLISFCLKLLYKMNIEATNGDKIGHMALEIGNKIRYMLPTDTTWGKIFSEGLLHKDPYSYRITIGNSNFTQEKIDLLRQLSIKGLTNWSRFFKEESFNKYCLSLKNFISTYIKNGFIDVKVNKVDQKVDLPIEKNEYSKNFFQNLPLSICCTSYKEKSFSGCALTPKIGPQELFGIRINSGFMPLHDYRFNFEFFQEEDIKIMQAVLPEFFVECLKKGIPITSKHTLGDLNGSKKRFLVYSDYETCKNLIKHIKQKIRIQPKIIEYNGKPNLFITKTIHIRSSDEAESIKRIVDLDMLSLEKESLK